MTTPHPWRLAELTYGTLRDHPVEVAVLPLGATEPHNTHLPYGMDTLESEIIGDRICERAHADGARVVLLPALPYGTETNQRAFPFAMNLDPSTVHAVVTNLVESLCLSGVRKVVLLNSHGGNELKPLLRELYGRTPAHIFLCDWIRMIRDVMPTIFDAPDDHAGEVETSIALAFAPDLVVHCDDGSLDADEGALRPLRFEALEQGWVSITRPWHLLTTNSGAGNPHAASADKGRRILDIIADRIAPFLVELSAATIDDDFPFAAGPWPAGEPG